MVAGLEPEFTNEFLLALANAATSGADTADAVAQVLARTGGAAAEPPPQAAAPTMPPPAAEVERAAPTMPPRPEAAAPTLPPRPPPTVAQSAEAQAQEQLAAAGINTAAPMPTATAQPAPLGPDRVLQQMASAPLRAEENTAPQTNEAEPKLARPRTARRAPPKLASNEVKVQRAAPDMAPAAGVIMEGGAADDDESIMIVDQAGEAVDTSSMHATDSAEHGKLVRNLLDAKAEMEAQAADAAAPPEPSADAGAAYGGIILGGKKERAGAGGGKMPTAAEITALRAKIQTLCQARADWDPRRAEMCAEVHCRDVRVTAARVRAEFEPSRPMPRVRARGPRRDGQGARAMARAPPAARHRARRGGEQDRALARVAPPGAGS